MTRAESRPDAVRLALPSEADVIAAVQRRSWPQLLGPAAVRLLESVSLADMTEIWHSAIARPPDARCRVLVATAAGTGNGRLVGFATTVPSPDEDAEPTDGAIEEFVIEPSAQHRGHGSRLLHACIDTLRADGFTLARLWVNSGNDALRGFLGLAGWAADGAWREIGRAEDDIAEIRLRQVRLHTDITAVDVGG